MTLGGSRTRASQEWLELDPESRNGLEWEELRSRGKWEEVGAGTHGVWGRKEREEKQKINLSGVGCQALEE